VREARWRGQRARRSQKIKGRKPQKPFYCWHGAKVF
jgi:hypothetical protein